MENDRKKLFDFYSLGEGEYYIKRDLVEDPNYEDSYWVTVEDPDGIQRDKLKEQDQHLNDMKEALAFINNLPGGKLLDIGCGLGFLLSGIDDKWEKHGVEISKFAAEHANKWGDVFVGSLSEAKYSDESFDLIVMNHLIEHVKDPEDLMVGVRRILKSNGRIVLGTPDFDSGCARLFQENYRLLKDKTHISLFSSDSMHRFLRDHGFIIDKVEYPFFNTRYFTEENILRLFDVTKVSPPFYGNFMTFYCHKQ